MVTRFRPPATPNLDAFNESEKSKRKKRDRLLITKSNRNRFQTQIAPPELVPSSQTVVPSSLATGEIRLFSNPNHDSHNGQFTHGPGGGGSGSESEGKEKSGEARVNAVVAKGRELLGPDLLDQIERDRSGSNLYISPDWHKAMDKAGISTESQDELRTHLHNWGGNESQQEHARGVLESALSQDTPLGEAFRTHIALETAAWEAYLGGGRHDLEREMQEIEWQKSMGHYKDYPWQYDTDVENATLKSQRDGMLYRKGPADRVMESWTTLEEGAGSGIATATHFGVDRRQTWAEIKAKGYALAGGAGLMMGAPGESERTLIKLPPSLPKLYSETQTEPYIFHLKGKHNQKSHGHEGSSHVADVSDTVKTAKGHVGEVTEYMDWQKKSWLKVPSQPGKQKWFEVDDVTVIKKGPGFDDAGKPLAGHTPAPAQSNLPPTPQNKEPEAKAPTPPPVASPSTPSPTPSAPPTPSVIRGTEAFSQPAGPGKPGVYEGFRVGSNADPLARGVYFAGEHAGAAPYASLHEGHSVEMYHITAKNPIVGENQFKILEQWGFGKKYYPGSFQDSHPKMLPEDRMRAIDKKFKAEAEKRGHDVGILTAPMPPAKNEIVVFNAKKAEIKNASAPAITSTATPPSSSTHYTLAKANTGYTGKAGSAKLFDEASAVMKTLDSKVVGNTYAAAQTKILGIDGPPQLVSKADLDKHIAAGELEIHRGFPTAESVEQFKHGDLHISLGGANEYGPGVYAAFKVAKPGESIKANPADEAAVYGPHVARMTLRKEARVIDFEKAYERGHAEGTSGHDWALRNGYDAIRAKGVGYLNILNRTMVRVEDSGHSTPSTQSPIGGTSQSFEKDLAASGWVKKPTGSEYILNVYSHPSIGYLERSAITKKWVLTPTGAGMAFNLGTDATHKDVEQYTHWTSVPENKPHVGTGGGTPVEAGSKAWHTANHPWLSGLTDHEKTAILDYAGGGLFGALNRALRGKADVLSVVHPVVTGIDSALAKSSTPYTATVYRGISADAVKDWKVGTTVQDHGYVSTTTSSTVAKNWGGSGRTLRIVVPKGSNGASIENLTHGDRGVEEKEKEFLLPRGTKFKVNKISNSYIDVEVIP